MRQIIKCGLGISLALLSACFEVRSQDRVQPESSQTPAAERLATLRLGEQEVQIETACTPAEQQKGLMFREKLPPNQGMLFVFSTERSLSFWMKNTLIPLSIAYINSKGVIIDIQDMQPRDETTHPSQKPAQYALEMNQGWFKSHQVQIGDSISLDKPCSNL